LTVALAAPLVGAEQPDVQTIIQKSVQANQADFAANPNFNYKETDRTPDGSKTYQVTMIEGTPYHRLIAVNGDPLSPDREEQEIRKQEQVTAQRKAESPSQRQQRITKWQQDQKRDQNMIDQLTKAFDFKLIGEGEARGSKIWKLRATPKPGYNPPNMDAQVLTGMQGELWIDQNTYQWVRVTAQVIHPVSIGGFLAQVEPGTRFEMEKIPAPGGSWQISHFSVHSHSRVLLLFHHHSNEEERYFDYRPVAHDAISSGN
jgi:hypothetical protein